MKLSLELFSKPIEPFQYPYYRIYWNGSCYIEDTVECKTVELDVDVKEGWNSFIFEIIDVFDVFDPLDGSTVVQTPFNINNLYTNNINSWPVKKNKGMLNAIDFHCDQLVWFSDRSVNAIVQGKTQQHFHGKGFTEICFFVSNNQITDHYYAGRSKIASYNYLNLECIKTDSFSKNLLGLSNVRLKDQFNVFPRGESTYEQHWGGLEFTINDLSNFKHKLPQWVSARPWPFKWIHARYYNKHLPLELAQEFFNE